MFTSQHLSRKDIAAGAVSSAADDREGKLIVDDMSGAAFILLGLWAESEAGAGDWVSPALLPGGT